MIDTDARVSDADLVQRARAGDRDAFAALLERHAPMAHRVCARLLGTTRGVDDVLQEAALQAWLGLNGLRDARQFGPWLAGTGLNLARRSLRTGPRDAWSWDAVVGAKLVREPVDDAAGPTELAEAEELARNVRAALADRAQAGPLSSRRLYWSADDGDWSSDEAGPRRAARAQPGAGGGVLSRRGGAAAAVAVR